MKTLAIEGNRGRPLEEILKIAADDGESVLLTENGEGRFYLGVVDDLAIEASILSRNEEFMRYLDGCRERGDREGNISLEDARKLLCPE